MKNLFIKAVIILITIQVSAQEDLASRETLTVLNIDSQGFDYTPQQLGNLVRIEVEKTNLFEVTDRYDVLYMIDKHQLKVDNCYGKLCLVEIGELLHSDKMLGGTVELYGETTIITLRLIDVKSKAIVKTTIREFLYLPDQLNIMLRFAVRELLGLENNKELSSSLSKIESFDNTINNPNIRSLRLSGPRMGFAYFTDKSQEYITNPEKDGGYNAYPLLFQFGYQFEIQYLNRGKAQALFEIIPNVTLINNKNFAPSISFLNGLRSNVNGWEIAAGVTFFLQKTHEGYYHEGKWYLKGEGPFSDALKDKAVGMETRVDSRGELEVLTNFVVAFGKTIRSGELNIPVNFYVSPDKDGVKLGVSFGFNAKKRKKR